MKNKTLPLILLKQSMCSSIHCSRQSILWRVFQGCGHSFHIECNLPNISVCKVCKELLTTKACSLGTTANSAVHNFGPTLDVQDTDCDEDESSDEDEDRDDSDSEFSPDGEHDEMKNTRAVLDLITEVNAWRRLEGPQS